MKSFGPVSEALLGEIREETRRHGLQVWLDPAGLYTDFVDALIADPEERGFSVFAFRGSFLELMLALDGRVEGLTSPPLLLHMPGFNEDEIRETPVYELYRAGRRYRKGLDTLIEQASAGRVVPTEIASAKASIATLAGADDWLSARLQGEGGEASIPLSDPPQLFDDLMKGGAIAQRLGDATVRDAVLRHLERRLGLDAQWWIDMDPGRLGDPREIRLLLTSWALCVEFVHDLNREPRDQVLRPLRKLPAALVKESCALAAHIRDSHPDDYERDADQIEADLKAERADVVAEDLGKIDTLRFEDQAVFEAALSALEGKLWQQAAHFAGHRTEERSFWVRRNPERRAGWQIVDLAAKLGSACVAQTGLLTGARDLDEAASLYTKSGWEVDRAQRQLEQAVQSLPLTRLEEFPALRRCIDEVRRSYRAWADELARAFNALCRSQGFLPQTARRQRELFDELVRPETEQGGPVAYFLVDALRFEMGQQLADWMGQDSGSRVRVDARYCELPSVTEVGMNVLAPLSQSGRLAIDQADGSIKGFRAGSARVDSPASRQKAMHERAGGETCPMLSLEALLTRDTKSIRASIRRARLVVVHAEGIDKAGEKGVGLGHFEQELQRLRSAWSQLRAAGVKTFVVTADHGFLIQDDTTRQPLSWGKKTDPKRRHVIVNEAPDRPGQVRVSSAELDYDGEPFQIIFPDSSQPFDTGEKTKVFLHGGNSLQERLIPVVVAKYAGELGGSPVTYEVSAKAQSQVMGQHRIKGTVVHQSQTTLGFGEDEEVELRLISPEDPELRIELIDAPSGRIAAGALVARVGESFELLFRVTGPLATRARVRIVSALGGVEIKPFDLVERYAVEVQHTEPAISGSNAPLTAPTAEAEAWLLDLPEGVREVFRRIQKHGAINEADATQVLGGARAFRQFSRNFVDYAARAPYTVRIDTESGQKRYMRGGGE